VRVYSTGGYPSSVDAPLAAGELYRGTLISGEACVAGVRMCKLWAVKAVNRVRHLLSLRQWKQFTSPTCKPSSGTHWNRSSGSY